VRKDPNLNLSTVHESIHYSRVRPNELETGLEWRHQDLSVRCCFQVGRSCLRPPIVHDESSRVLLAWSSPAIASASPAVFNGGAVCASGQQETRASRLSEAAVIVVKTGKTAGAFYPSTDRDGEVLGDAVIGNARGGAENDVGALPNAGRYFH